ncbi:MAG: CpaF family protein [Bacillota bacterium]|nr:CpaF family protein [Bacillota bacterium]
MSKQPYPGKIEAKSEDSRRPSPVAPERSRLLSDISWETLRRIIDTIKDYANLDASDLKRRKQIQGQIIDIMEDVLREQSHHLSQVDRQKVIKQVTDEIFGFGPINSLINDPTVTEIMVNGPNQVYVEREGKLYHADINFRDNAHVMHTIDKIITPLGRRIDESSPMVDARLPDGSRVNAIIPPLAIKGPTITIRKFATDPYTSEDLISFGTMTKDIAQFLKACVRARLNIIISGGSGTGKTTTLNVLSSFIPNTDRIVTIEDAAELQLKQDHVVSLESRPPNIEGKGQVTIRDLVINSLRMRPDRIVVGEARGGEALDMLQAMNTGHDGSISTVHANTARDALARLETMVLMAGMDLPIRAIREQVAAAIDLIIHIQRYSDGTRKLFKISEVVGMEGDMITMQDLFIFKHSGLNEKGFVTGKHLPTGIIPKFIEKIQLSGESLPMKIFEGEETEKVRWGGS